MISCRDPDTLRSRAATLAADPDDADARRGAAEALLRIALIEGGDDAPQLLRRATELDPYRGELWLLLAGHDRAAGALDLALDRLDVAASLMPGDRRVALARARVLRELAIASRRSELGDRAAAELEPVLAAAPGDPVVLAAMIESLLHGTQPARIPALLARVQPGPGVERLALLVVMMGDAAAVDAAIALASRCTPPLDGVIATARAKTMTADELCERADALGIADGRIVRLLLRERLATVADPVRRLALLERAIAKVPSLDGIAHDQLQLQHLVAKRAIATGDTEAARAAWRACLARDRDNLAVVENLARFGDDDGARIAELRAIYVAHGPRPDLVLLRVAAAVLTDVQARLANPIELADAPVDALARGLALLRLARDPSARTATPQPAIAALLDGPALEAAVAVIEQPPLSTTDVADVIDTHARLLRTLLDALAGCASLDIPARAAVVATARMLAPDFVRAAMRDDEAFPRALLAPLVEAARRDFTAGHIEAGLDRLAAHAELAAGYADYHELVARHTASDPRISAEEVAERVRDHARRAVAARGGTSPDAAIAQMAGEDEVAFAQRIAVQRAHALLARRKERAALDALWWAHPDTEGKPPAAGMPVLAWLQVRRTGTPLYRLSTATAMHAATRAWYATQQSVTRFAAADTSRSAMLALRTAFWWLAAAREADPSLATEHLLGALHADQKRLLS